MTFILVSIACTVSRNWQAFQMATVSSCLQGPKIEGGRASARSLSFDGQSAAAAAKSGVPIDLMTVAARVDAGRRQLVLGHLPSSDMSEST